MSRSNQESLRNSLYNLSNNQNSGKNQFSNPPETTRQATKRSMIEEGNSQSYLMAKNKTVRTQESLWRKIVSQPSVKDKHPLIEPINVFLAKNQLGQELEKPIIGLIKYIEQTENELSLKQRELLTLQQLYTLLTENMAKQDNMFQRLTFENQDLKQEIARLQNLVNECKQKQQELMQNLEIYQPKNDLNYEPSIRGFDNLPRLNNTLQPMRKDSVTSNLGQRQRPPQLIKVQKVHGSVDSLNQTHENLDTSGYYQTNGADEQVHSPLTKRQLNHLIATQSPLMRSIQKRPQPMDNQLLRKYTENNTTSIQKDPSSGVDHQMRKKSNFSKNVHKKIPLNVGPTGNSGDVLGESKTARITMTLANSDDMKENMNLRSNFISHHTEFLFFKNILEMESDQKLDAIQQFANHKCVEFLLPYVSHEIIFYNKFQDKEIPTKPLNAPDSVPVYIPNTNIMGYHNPSAKANIIKLIANGDKTSHNQLRDSIDFLYQVSISSLNMIQRLKSLVRSVTSLQNTLLANDIIDDIITHTTILLKCDRASVFLADTQRNELWTKGAKGTNTIRIPLSKGIAGFVATTGKMQNILDAHQDPRFNRDIDKQTNYRTRSILCTPIISSTDPDRVIGKQKEKKLDNYCKFHLHFEGVIQAINKVKQPTQEEKEKFADKTQKEELEMLTEGEYFSQQDEGILLLLTQVAEGILRNSMATDKNTEFLNSLRGLLRTSVILQSCVSIEELNKQAERRLIAVFNAPQAQVYFYNKESKMLTRFEPHKSDVESFDSSIGICGEVFQSRQYRIILNGYTDIVFNQLVDIQTNMPVLCVPINTLQNTESLGVLQIIHPKGIENMLFNTNTSSTSITSTFIESLDNFSKILGQTLVNLMNMLNQNS